ncbi:MAG: hypothetical protein ACI9FN_003982 [Saprospiraceae bacterium]|jgi:hypothetical protein
MAGLYLTRIRGSVGGMIGNIFITINATVILVSIYFTIRYALARKIHLHSQWALRLFLGMSGVWFFRVYLMFWIGINQGPVGFDPEAFQGLALTTLYANSYILPLVILEGYFYAQRNMDVISQYLVITFLIVLSLCTIFGIPIATVGMWWPNM